MAIAVEERKKATTRKRRSSAAGAPKPDERTYLFSREKMLLHGRELGTGEMLPQWEGKFYFDETEAQRVVNFVENYIHHVEGPLAGELFHLEPWERASLREIFGWYRCSDRTRKYRRVYFFLPRKNGKSMLASAIALYLLLCDGEKGAQIYSAAADREQAAIVFDVAKKMVQESPELLDLCEPFKRSIVDYDMGSTYKVLSADAPNKHGKNSHGILFDELHTQKSRELWDTLTTSTSARAQPLIVAMTTAGYDKTTICWEVHDYAQNVRDGIVEDEEFLPIMFGADEDDDWTAEATWFKANPNLGISKSLEYMRAECKRAQNSPSYENTFRRLELNQWTEQESRWLQIKKWDLCGKPVSAKALEGEPCYLGLDLASNRDIAAMAAAFPREVAKVKVPKDTIKQLLRKITDKDLQRERLVTLGIDPDTLTRTLRFYDALFWFWCPEEMVKMRSSTHSIAGAGADVSKVMRAKYDGWVRSGDLLSTPGDVIDYDIIRQTVRDIGDVYDVKEIAIDRWNATQITTQLKGDGFTMVPFGQGYASMGAPTKELETLILSQRIRHGGHPVARWMAKNVAVTTDPAGNLKPNKEKSADKIDGIVALIMAIGRASVNDDSSVYDERGLLTT